MPKLLAALAALVVFQLVGSTPARAQTAPSAPKSDEAKDEAASKPPRDPDAELIERLLAEDSADPDLAWLYSNADEYSPSTLTGKPIPAPALPERGQGSPRAWDPRWRKFGTADYFATGAGLLAAVAASFVPPVEARWRKRNRFDEWGRENLGIQDYDEGLWARDLSDVLVSVNVAYPLLVDALIVTHWYRRSPELAGQMALISVETMAVSMGIQGLTSAIASRERPYVRNCGGELNPELDDCVETNRYRSYFSGHTSNAFTAATLTCGHHLRHDLFGSAVADATACGVAYASATTVGLMRVVGQRHFLTDVLSGATVGTLVGWGLPWLLHYGPLARDDAAAPAPQTGVTLNLVPLPNGAALGGTF